MTLRIGMPRLGNLASRVLVAAIAVPILLVVIYQDHHEIVWGLMFVASLLAMYELFAMTLEDRTDRIAAVIMGAACSIAFYWLEPQHAPVLVAFLGAFFGAALYFLFRPGDIATVATRLAFTVFGIIYGGLLFAFLALVKRDMGPRAGDFIVLILCTAWLSDTGGYFAGKYLGKKKLYPAVSPNKTWAGSIGGVLTAVAGGFVLERWRPQLHDLTWYDVVLLTGVGSVFGQIGDLAESLLKRSRGVKDSGAILPGHGGLLDRVDAVLFVAPYFYLYALLR
ncbi:MAG TPA: phosphatidate cytidylyltransferase [Kofleriaceae bacterium]